ncbi:MAG TPA: hypothetical protein VJ124_06965, partial [Pyrinomonadaceae bacterium]|nr:hypothetical protein [Pyrinomonadaceae bacterium]
VEIVKSPKLVNGSSAGTTRSAAVQKRKAVETEFREKAFCSGPFLVAWTICLSNEALKHETAWTGSPCHPKDLASVSRRTPKQVPPNWIG